MSLLKRIEEIKTEQRAFQKRKGDYHEGVTHGVEMVQEMFSEIAVSFPKLKDKKGNVGWKAHIDLVEQWFEERFAGLEAEEK